MSCRGENGHKLSFRLLRVMTTLITSQLYCSIQIPAHREPWFYLLPDCGGSNSLLYPYANKTQLEEY